MPFITARVNVSVNKSQEIEIKTLMGQAIELIPGKNENYLMLGLEDNYKFYLRGDDSQKAALIDAQIFGNEDHDGFNKFAAMTTKIFNSVLDIPPENIYINFYDIKAWSVNGIFITR